MKYCTNCGKKINVVVPKFCPECGFSFSASIASAESNEIIEEDELESGKTQFSIDRDAVDIVIDNFEKPANIGSLVSQGQGLKRSEIYGPRRAPDPTSKLSAEELKKSLISECAKSRKSKDIEED